MIAKWRPATEPIRRASAFAFGRWTIVILDDVAAGADIDFGSNVLSVQCANDSVESVAVATPNRGVIRGRYAGGTITAVVYPGADRGSVPPLSPVVFRAITAIVAAESEDEAEQLGVIVRAVVEKGVRGVARLIRVASDWALVFLPGQPRATRTYAYDVRCRFTVIAPDGRMRMTETCSLNVAVQNQPCTLALVEIPSGWRDVVVYRQTADGEGEVAAGGAWENATRNSALHDVLGAMGLDEDVSFVLRALVREAFALRATEAERQLRAHTPPVVRQFADKDKPVGFYVEEFLTFAGSGYLVCGWINDPEELIDGVYLVPPSGKRLPIEFDQCRMQRADVLEFYAIVPSAETPVFPGFVSFVRDSDAVDSRVDDIVLAIRGAGPVWLACKQTVVGPLEKRSHLLRSADTRHVLDMERLAPAFEAAQREVVAAARVSATFDFNNHEPVPRYSLVVPLFRRVDFVRYQLAEFANDPEIRDAEVVYVLDSPEQKADLLRLMESWTVLWPVRVRLAIMASNVGYAAATNWGVRNSRGELCVLLNSDVFPAGPGWLGRMATALTEVGSVGIVGARLLYEDTAIQHAGMYYALNRLGLWANEHYYKGYPGDFPDANVSRYVPAVTGACMMVRRELFEAIGGLSEDYCVGDFEDSDFCNKAAAAGYRSWYEATATLYHLERQSFPLSAYNHLGWQYNQWLHERRWRHATEAAGILRAAR